MACRITNNRHGILTFRISWLGKRFWKSTGRRDTTRNRAYVEGLGRVISDAMERGTFSLDWFEETNKTTQRKEEDGRPETVGEYFRVWIQRQRPPLVRPHLERDYREHFERYILPKFANTPLRGVTPSMIEALRSYLIHDWKNRNTGKPLSLKSAKNVIGGSLRALWRDARTVDYLVDRDPFQALTWPRMPTNRPDPFTEEERDNLLAYFRAKVPFYFPFLHVLFWTGMRPSEALALRWGDVDLRNGYISITKSRTLDAEGSPKTAGSERQIRLLSFVIEVLSVAKPLHSCETDHVFRNEAGQPVKFHTWRKKHWYRALRAKGMRERKPYSTRHSFISLGLSNGVNIKWLADYCGTSVAMIEKHYGRYIKDDAEEQLGRLLGETVTQAVTLEEEKRVNQSQGPDNAGVKVGGPTWIRTRTGRQSVGGEKANNPVTIQ